MSLSVGVGEIVGIAGVAGNGQRELAEVISGMRPMVAGAITVQATSAVGGGVGATAGTGDQITLTPQNSTGGVPVAGGIIARWLCGPAAGTAGVDPRFLPGSCRGT